MIPEALLVCPHQDSARALQPVLEQLGTRVECHQDAMVALTRLWSYRYDAVIVDCEGRGDEAEVVREVHEAALNRNAVTIAVIGAGEDPDLAYALGAHFVLRKPLTSTRVRRLLRAAHALITQERRRHQRFLCEGPATLVCGAQELPAELVDVSQGGVALQLDRKLDEGCAAVRLRFRLPGTTDVIAPAAEVAWQNAWRRAGLRFTAVTPDDQSRLLRWLDQARDRQAHAHA